MLNQQSGMGQRGQISQLIGKICLIISLLYSILQVSAVPYVGKLHNRYLLVLVTLAVAIKYFIREEHEFKYILFSGLFLVLSIVVSVQAHDCTPVVMVMLAYLTRDLKLDTIAKAAFFTLSLSLAILYLLSLSGWLIDYHVMREGIMRHSFGLTQPTLFSDLVFLAMAAYVYMKKELGILSICLLLGAAALTYYFADARNDTLSIFLLIIAPYFLKPHYSRMFHRIGGALALCSYPLFAFLAIAVTKMYTYNKGIIGNIDLNEMLSGRLYLGNLAFQRYSIKLLGQHVIENAGGRVNFYHFVQPYFYIDSSYLHLLFKFGLIYTCLFFGLVIWKMLRSINRKDYLLVAIVIVVGIETIWEANLLSPLNFTLLMLMVGISKKMKSTSEAIDHISD